MKEFFDTSVFVAAFWKGHANHEASLNLIASASKRKSACALHTLAEVYATMTALPVKQKIPSDQALRFVEEVRDRCAIIALNEDEYYATIQECAAGHFTSGKIYDALLLRCALKSKAQCIYTWNIKHFQSLAPELLDRIRTP